jgi:HTH-type transcriptional regulator / antitoxin HipB
VRAITPYTSIAYNHSSYASAHILKLIAIAYIDNLCVLAYEYKFVRGPSMQQITRTRSQIGAALRRQRKNLGLSQEQLGDKTHLRQATISSLEGGDAGTKLGTLLDVLAALDLELVIRSRTRGRITDVENIF